MDQILQQGAIKAQSVANETLYRVRKSLGFYWLSIKSWTKDSSFKSLLSCDFIYIIIISTNDFRPPACSGSISSAETPS